ncbi:multidrug efflux MFS transporter [Selenomonas sp. WCA-380-WT-3B 3/]|uniref:Multidrug efflux MFS transporter n=1 Tax=Selenomonas montiformis TaxID=2652285 RepID=A0A6I2UY16_9FIRM|nr:MFS transporter [Selenomonas montiformis]MSV24551.1 multidrug efflux MFS transporter [Selenomonas montiformis]
MEIWKRNLYICCLASFIVSAGMSQMAPILPLYIAELGVADSGDVARWAGIVFGCNFISLAVFSPIWGKLADRYGRKPMILRASGWLGLIMIGMSFAQSVWHLVVLRLLQGCLSGFQAAVVPLIAQETPREHSGWAMGMFFTAQVTGGLLGPLIGGMISELIGIRHSFLLMGSLCLLGFLALTQVRETRRTAAAGTPAGLRDVFSALPHRRAVVGLFLTTLVLHFSLTCIQPILTVYVSELAPDTEHLAVISGAVFSSAGFASMLTASRLGHISDRIGAQNVLTACLLLAGLVSIPQGLVTAPWQLALLRFLHGIAIAGLMPSVNSLIRQLTPPDCLGQIYGFNQSAQFIGMFSGAFFGGHLAAVFGIRQMFFAVALLLLIDAAWCRRTEKTE